jgi:hypothetical protein
MPAARRKTPIINLNLLYPQGIPQALPVKFFHWVLSYGRFIVIVVEVIILITFGLRFKLDQDLVELNRKINQQVPFIQGLTQDDALINQTQLRLSLIKTTYDATPDYVTDLRKIAASTPSSIRYDSFVLIPVPQSKALQFKITAQTPSNKDFGNFFKALKANTKDFADVTLSSVSFNEGSVMFSISGTIN